MTQMHFLPTEKTEQSAGLKNEEKGRRDAIKLWREMTRFSCRQKKLISCMSGWAPKHPQLSAGQPPDDVNFLCVLLLGGLAMKGEKDDETTG